MMGRPHLSIGQSINLLLFFFDCFGSLAYLHIPKKLREKLDRKSLKVVFVGYYTHSKGYHFWDSKHRCIIISRNVLFDESFMPNDNTTLVAIS
jgi:hypothetical protein